VKVARILIVEDNAVTRKMLRVALQAEGYAVVEAEDGASALRLASEHEPAIVLLDCKLPDSDGFEIARQLHEAAPGLPIIAVTGWAVADEAAMSTAGFLDVLTKPVQPSRLVEVIRRHLGHVPASPSSAGKTVLLAEDDPMQRRLARLALVTAGFSVVVAEDGAAALRLAREHKPDVILSDVLMPGLDGFALCRAIRSDGQLSGVPVVLMSAYYLEEQDRDLGTRVGATRYVSRSAGLDAVVQALFDAVDSPATDPIDASNLEVDADYLRRIARQLERQAAIGAGLAHRVTLQETALSILDGLSDSLSHQLDPESALGDTLAECLDAAGLSVGMILLFDQSGQLVARAHVGSKAGFDWAPHATVLSLAMGRGGLLMPSAEAGRRGEDLLVALGVRSALVVPIVARDETLGLLVLASPRSDLAGGDGESFARAARSLSKQLGQSLALSRAFSKLSESEARYRRVIETTNQGVWLMDAEARTTLVNSRMAEILGRAVGEIVGRPPAEFLDAGGLAVFAKHMDRHEQGQHARSEVEFRRSDGTSTWTLLESSPLRDDAGRINGAFAMVMDITERRRAEEARLLAEEAQRASEAEYRALFENSPLPKFVYDLDTLRFLAVNDATVQSYGYGKDELLGMTVKDILSPEDLLQDLSRVQDDLPDGPRGVHRHRKKDGTLFDVEIHIHTFTQGNTRRRLTVAKDVTEQKRLEDQLRQAQKMEAVGRLAGGVAHDFNNILSVILSYGNMLLEDLATGEPMRDDISEIVKAGQRAAGLTRQLLMFSRQQVLDPKVLNLNDLLANIDKMLRRILGADIDFASVPERKLGMVRADPGSIEQVVMNLVVNARDAMPTGGKLTIETSNVVLDDEYASQHPGSQPGPHVMLGVSDTGIGMDRATLSRIFEPFFTTKSKDKGTGLGLSTVFGIVHQSGGAVRVDSEPGKGTTFKVFLPRVDAAVDAAESARPPRVVGGTETILVVDDDEQVRVVARAILQKNGYRILEARDAGEALLQTQSYQGAIHLLLTDVVMPHMSGPVLAKQLAASRPGMKVLCMSGYTDDSIVRHGVIEGRVAFLQKPLTPQGLTLKVREVLDGNGK
jgi:two-component system cell cycle sensor histidine kinase/response regulator CckA